MSKKNPEPRKIKPTKKKSSAQKKAAKQRRPRWDQTHGAGVKLGWKKSCRRVAFFVGMFF